MGGRAPLKTRAPRLLGDHSGTVGRAYRRAYDALTSELGPKPGACYPSPVTGRCFPPCADCARPPLPAGPCEKFEAHGPEAVEEAR